MTDALSNEKKHLARLLEAVQRSAYFLHLSYSKLDWPIDAMWLKDNRKDAELFETLAAINERFSKLQDTLASGMRHSALLMSEPTESFLKVLAFFEKQGVVESVELWQQSRMARNAAAHDYETDYMLIAEHFNMLAELIPMLLSTGRELLSLVTRELRVQPASADFDAEFNSMFSQERGG